jgi:uncharacterized surface protein with fasciclin (FAS1) repeats
MLSIFLLPVAILPVPSSDSCAASASREHKTIVETAVSAGTFNTLVTAVKAAGLAETLAGKGPFTVFAPTDEAFAKLPAGTVENLLKPENREKLVAILKAHIVEGRVLAKDVTKLTKATTIGRFELPIEATSAGVKAGGAQVVKTDVLAKNGVIHVIDAVIVP